MTDLDRAIAAAREALAKYDRAELVDELIPCAAHSSEALRDLLAALYAARGEAVAWVDADTLAEVEPQYALRTSLYGSNTSGDRIPLYAAPPAALAVPADFTEWLAREMPAGTVIGDPQWWANLIARRFAQFASKEPAGAMFRHKESGRTRLVLEDEADDFEEMNATWTRVGAVYLSPSIKESAND